MTLTAVRPSRIATELGEVALRMSALLGDTSGGSAVHILTSLSLTRVSNASGAGVTLIGAGAGVGAGGEGWTSCAATSEVVLEADSLQYHLNEGPCLDACLQAATVRVTNVGLDPRWPVWSKAVRPLNIASVMSIPLVNAGHVRGTIKVYCDIPGAFDEPTVSLLDDLARSVTLLLPVSPPVD